MQKPRFTDFSDFVAAALCFVVAFSLQIQVTLFKSETYLGLRINLTDLIVPLAGAVILGTLLTRKSLWPAWHMKHIYVWLAAMTAALFLAVINTYLNFGEFSRWAIVNKFGGWVILLGIMGMGAWIATNAREVWIQSFLKLFLYAAMAVLVWEIGLVILRTLPALRPYVGFPQNSFYPIDGFMANRNAYGLLFIAVISLATALYLSKIQNVVTEKYVYLLYFLIPQFVLINGSRATFIALSVIVPLFFLYFRKGKKIRNLVLCILAGVFFIGLVIARDPQQFMSIRDNQLEFLDAAGEASSLDELKDKKIQYPGDQMRLIILDDATEMLKERPILGSGLGSMMIYQEEKHGEMINLIDCTALWILTEMGIVGLLLFAAFYVVATKSMYEAHKQDDDFPKALRTALFFILIGFTLMSLFHEIMYTRFIWFFLGLGLALPSRMRRPE